MDRRQQKTRSAIFEAFSNLLSYKSYSKITVQEIIDSANVGRTTFYAHFPTKDDLLRESCTDLFNHVFSDNPGIEATHNFSLTAGKPDSAITHILYHLRDNKKNIIGILSCESSPQVGQGMHQCSCVLTSNAFSMREIPMIVGVDTQTMRRFQKFCVLFAASDKGSPSVPAEMG